jgi:hypothetical protein
MHSSARAGGASDLRGISTPRRSGGVRHPARGLAAGARVPLAILASQGRVGPIGDSACVKAANALEGGHRNIRVRCRVELNRVQGTFPHGAIGRVSSLRKGMLGHGKRRPRREIARFLVANGAGMAAIGTGARCQEVLRSRLRIRVFQIGLLRELLPSLGHFLQDPLLLLSCCLLGQTAAFLREALVLG